ncbi:gamma-glutamylcyclotransferase [Allorhizobium undicola]|uniref:gamma-glutamylcyclotransferase n=1 Tax=Allorhizobium undicola TaxID=78527 RepID=UPI00048862C9|nr:gamma-glutamylcyclotransferase [Allorhizobium undicola]
MYWDMNEFWVFGYGSLMWNPGFPFQEKISARAHGYRRSLCVRSWHHRGSQERPGLVLGLDFGGSCHGVAFRVGPAEWPGALSYLRERELVTHVYKERTLSLLLGDGRAVQALGYVVDRDHPQYAGRLSVDEAVGVVANASGHSGPNDAYVLNTVAHLRSMGIRDRWLESVASQLDA